MDVEVQVELDSEWTVRVLPIDDQGLMKSYLIDDPTEISQSNSTAASLGT